MEFSARTRQENLNRFSQTRFDLLVVGGGITGAAVARDASSRGMKVALIEKSDLASGTSSRSSKLIHGGLRYLENFEFKLVFEALSERAFLLKKGSKRVRPLPFYFPIYDTDPHSMPQLSAGLWLYDLLALFRAPGFHKRLTPEKIAREIPGLKSAGLRGGFRYFDASMSDDLMVVDNARDAQRLGAAVATFIEATEPLWDGERITGFHCVDRLNHDAPLTVQADRVALCVGAWIDRLGPRMSQEWQPWLAPSQGIHLVFDSSRFPLPGAVVMSHPEDGRISFAMPRSDLGNGVTIVGTTDGPVKGEFEAPEAQASEIRYLMDLLSRFFGELRLTDQDIVGIYTGIRPLVKPDAGASLQKTSREHSIELGPGGTIMVGGGKYTTHRTMAREIVDFALKRIPMQGLIESRTDIPCVVPDEKKLISQLDQKARADLMITEPDPDGFPNLMGQLAYQMRCGLTMRLSDFMFYRCPIGWTRADSGMPWIDDLAKVFAAEMNDLDLNHDTTIELEIARFKDELAKRGSWKTRLANPA